MVELNISEASGMSTVHSELWTGLVLASIAFIQVMRYTAVSVAPTLLTHSLVLHKNRMVMLIRYYDIQINATHEAVLSSYSCTTATVVTPVRFT